MEARTYVVASGDITVFVDLAAPFNIYLVASAVDGGLFSLGRDRSLSSVSLLISIQGCHVSLDKENK